MLTRPLYRPGAGALGSDIRDLRGYGASRQRRYYRDGLGAAPDAVPATRNVDPMTPSTPGTPESLPQNIRLSDGSFWDTRFHPRTGAPIPPEQARKLLQSAAELRSTTVSDVLAAGTPVRVGDLVHVASGGGPKQLFTGEGLGAGTSANGGKGPPPAKPTDVVGAMRAEWNRTATAPVLRAVTGVGKLSMDPITGRYTRTELAGYEGSTMPQEDFSSVLEADSKLHYRALTATEIDAKLERQSMAGWTQGMRTANASLDRAYPQSVVDADYELARAGERSDYHPGALSETYDNWKGWTG